MDNKGLLNYYISDDTDKMLAELEKMSYHEIFKFIGEYVLKWIKENKSSELNPYDYNAYDYFCDHLTKNQLERFRYINSRERTQRFIFEKAEQYGDDSLTNEDWLDLRMIDF